MSSLSIHSLLGPHGHERVFFDQYQFDRGSFRSFQLVTTAPLKANRLINVLPTPIMGLSMRQ